MVKPDIDFGTAFSDTFALIRQRPLWILIWGALLFVVPMLPAIPLFGWLLSNIDLWMNDPEAISQAGGVTALANLSSILQLVLLIPILAAIIRYVLGKSRPSGFADLRFGMDELWVFVTCIALYVGMVIALMIVVMIAVVIGALIAVAGGEVAGVLSGILIGLLLLLPLVWLAIRFSLLLPASVDLNNFALAEAWRASKGRFWPLFGVGLLSALACFGLTILAMIIFVIIAVVVVMIGAATGMASVGTDPSTWNWVPMVLIGGALAIVPLVWLSAASYVLYCGPFASVWRQLKPAIVAAPQPVAEPEI